MRSPGAAGFDDDAIVHELIPTFPKGTVVVVEVVDVVVVVGATVVVVVVVDVVVVVVVVVVGETVGGAVVDVVVDVVSMVMDNTFPLVLAFPAASVYFVAATWIVAVPAKEVSGVNVAV
jgi:hypothetical protein